MRQVEPPGRKAASAAEDDEDDAIDLFGSDEEEDKEAARLREERLRQYAEKKAKKPALVAKSSILLDVKPVSGPPLPPPPWCLDCSGGNGTFPGVCGPLTQPLYPPPLQWDDETDMAQLEACVRSIQLDGLTWGGSKLVPVGYGIRKLQIQCVVEDDKVGTDLLEEEITKFEEHVSGQAPTHTHGLVGGQSGWVSGRLGPATSGLPFPQVQSVDIAAFNKI